MRSFAVKLSAPFDSYRRHGPRPGETENVSTQARPQDPTFASHSAADADGSSLQRAGQLGRTLIENVGTVVRGKQLQVELAVTTLLAGGHLLIEDVPGVGKTILARSLAISVGGKFSRIQGTPDLMPADVTGTNIYSRESEEFVFHPGPVFANVVLVDEINRATPRTQSALLEAMEEGQVSVDGQSYGLPEPFCLLATQNPVEYHGTYPLPEGQLDRFMCAISIGYPDRTSERDILVSQSHGHPIEQLQPICTLEQLVDARADIRGVYTAPAIVDYVIALADQTRRSASVSIGASPRGSLALLHAAQARAVVRGRDYVVPDDVKAMAPGVLGHRMVLAQGAQSIGAGRTLVERLMSDVAVPTDGAR